MAEVCSCDVCGKSPANRVEVGIVMWDVAAPGAPTGASEAVDACPACQEPAMDALTEHLRETLREQVPLHVKLGENAALLEEVQVPLQELTFAVRAHEETYAGSPTIPELPKKVRDKHAALSVRAAELTEERLGIVEEGRKLHDARLKKFRKSLPAKKR